MGHDDIVDEFLNQQSSFQGNVETSAAVEGIGATTWARSLSTCEG
jgi:hypothetical protein